MNKWIILLFTLVISDHCKKTGTSRNLATSMQYLQFSSGSSPPSFQSTASLKLSIRSSMQSPSESVSSDRLSILDESTREFVHQTNQYSGVQFTFLQQKDCIRIQRRLMIALRFLLRISCGFILLAAKLSLVHKLSTSLISWSWSDFYLLSAEIWNKLLSPTTS